MIAREFLQGVLAAILFAECDMNNPEGDDTSLESHGHSVEDFADDARESLRHDAVSWLWENRRLIRAAMTTGYTVEQAGHDWYFTHAGHGVGYWDRGLGKLGKMLSERCPLREFNVWEDENGTLQIG